MSLYRYCVVCNADREFTSEKRDQTFEVRGDCIELNLPIVICSVCKSEEVADSYGKDPVDVAFSEYRRRHRLLTSLEIKELRTKYKLSQKAFAHLLGMSEATVNRYEKGALQDFAHDSALRAFYHPAYVLDAIKRRGDVLSTSQKNKTIAIVELELEGVKH